MGGWYAKPLAEVPSVPPEQPQDPDWRPLQHHFRLTGFGANAYTAAEVGQELLGEHDELASGQEELYVVIAGEARFTLDGERVAAPAPFVVAVPDPAVIRSAVALVGGTTVLALGAEGGERFRSRWREDHVRDIPLAGL